MPKDRETGTGKGFAFVDMSTPEEVETAVAALHATEYGGRSLRVQKSLPKDKQAKKTGTYVRRIMRGEYIMWWMIFYFVRSKMFYGDTDRL